MKALDAASGVDLARWGSHVANEQIFGLGGGEGGGLQCSRR